MKAELNAQLDEQEAERELTLTCRVSRRWLALNAVLVVAIGAVLFLPAPGAAAAVKPVTVYAATKPTAVYAAEPTLAAGFAVQTAPAEDRDDDHPPWMAPTPPRHQQHKLQHPNASAADGDGPASQAVTADERCTLRAACPSSPSKVLVTLSIGKRSHFGVLRVPMEAYARRIGAEFVVVDSASHPSLARWNATLHAGANSHFLKLPLLQWFLQHYDRVLFLDDDVLVAPYAPDLFAAVPCASIGATIESVHKQGWHTMHTKSLCGIYELQLGRTHSSVCSEDGARRARIFNSGVLVLSTAHLPLLRGWEARKLECRILCDQLYLNAMRHAHEVCLHDLGTRFNLPGTAVRKMITDTQGARAADASSSAAAAAALRASALGTSCFIHLTVLPSKSDSSHYLLQRALTSADVLQCDQGTKGAAAWTEVDSAAMLSALPPRRYSEAQLTEILCKKKKQLGDCRILPPRGATVTRLALPSAADGEGGGSGGGPASGAAPPPSTAPSTDPAVCATHLAAAEAAADPPLPPRVTGNASLELPPSARRVLHRAASSSWDCKTVILLFATSDFKDLAINWAQAATSVNVTNFVLVAMDQKLGQILARFDTGSAPGLLLPRVASGALVVSKLNVIGERQRFGLRALEAGFNVLFVDLDGILLRSPGPLLRDGDIIGERIWGRPGSIVKKWGAAICTGFYFVRSTRQTIRIFRATHQLIAAKRAKMKRWQASDQWAINHAVDSADVQWRTPSPMKGINDFHSKFYDEQPAWGFTKDPKAKFVVLPHVHVPRSCPILRHGAARPPRTERGESKKYELWRHLLDRAYVLHCFPPDSMPCPGKKHGEKGCDKSVIMGAAVHIHGEVVFDQRQGLWFMRRGWEAALDAPVQRDFFAWLRAQHNGARPGEAALGS